MLLWLLASPTAAASQPLHLAALKPAPAKDLYKFESPPGTPAAPEPGSERHIAHRILDLTDPYDPENPARATLQRHDDATRNMPHDANGFPDWMRALREGTIAPRATLDGKEDPDIFDLDIILRNTKEMPNVRFPHSSHTMWLTCSNCHPTPFIPQAGANQIRMEDIFRGKFCGMCHDRVAFITFASCFRCHSVPKAYTQPKEGFSKPKK